MPLTHNSSTDPLRRKILKLIIQALTPILPILLLAAGRGDSGPDQVRWKQDGALLVQVPAGEFRLGSDTGPEASRPERRVSLNTFYLDRTEVTNGQYFRFCRETGRPLPIHLRPEAIPPGRENLPVNHVTWDDADTYCRWAGRRLPSEAEWEKAARGTDGRTYPWGNGWDPGRSHNRTNSNESPAPAGSYPRGQSPYGALDLAGNVWEWTADWYRGYPGGPLKFDETGKRRVARGGAFFYSIDLLKSYARYPLDPEDATEHGGFRCAVSIPAE